MRFVSVSAMAMLAVFMCPVVFAATVAPVQGNVSINRGSGYEPISGPTQAKVGDTVMARPGGSARVVYSGQCSVVVKPGHVVVIASEPPCKKTAAFDPYGTRMNVGVAPGEGVAEHHWLPYAAVGVWAVVAGLCIGDVICDDHAASP